MGTSSLPSPPRCRRCSGAGHWPARPDITPARASTDTSGENPPHAAPKNQYFSTKRSKIVSQTGTSQWRDRLTIPAPGGQGERRHHVSREQSHVADVNLSILCIIVWGMCRLDWSGKSVYDAWYICVYTEGKCAIRTSRPLCGGDAILRALKPMVWSRPHTPLHRNQCVQCRDQCVQKRQRPSE